MNEPLTKQSMKQMIQRSIPDRTRQTKFSTMQSIIIWQTCHAIPMKITKLQNRNTTQSQAPIRQNLATHTVRNNTDHQTENKKYG